MDDFITFYPNEFSAEELEAIERYKNGQMPALFGDTGGIRPATRFDILLYNNCWDRWNPLFTDEQYAKNTWYGDIPAIPCYRSSPARSTLPEELGGAAYAKSQFFVGDGYDHEIHYFKPIVPGDTFTSKNTRFDIHDATPSGGSTTRVLIKPQHATSIIYSPFSVMYLSVT